VTDKIQLFATIFKRFPKAREGRIDEYSILYEKKSVFGSIIEENTQP